jgi:hypothetical protein
VDGRDAMETKETGELRTESEKKGDNRTEWEERETENTGTDRAREREMGEDWQHTKRENTMTKARGDERKERKLIRGRGTEWRGKEKKQKF